MSAKDETAEDLTQEQRQKLRGSLCAEHDELTALTSRTKNDRTPVELDQQSVGRLSRMDALQQHSMDIAREERRALRRQMIAAALVRIDDGEYGYCLRCGNNIPYERLQADAAAARCIACVS
jgi:DnaK suppressor protein